MRSTFRSPRSPVARLLGATSALAVLLFAAAAVAAPTGGWRVAPAPGWITQVDSGPAGSAAPAPKRGDRCLLFDRQLRTTSGTVESYVRLTREILDEPGLASASQVRIDFDPTYQSLDVHEVVIHRAGATLNRLVPAAIKVIEREKGLEEQVFDGRKSAVLFIDDLRVGDVLDYAYTLRGSDPTLGPHFADEILLGAPETVAHLHARLVVPSGSPLHFAAHGPPAPGQTHEASRGGALEYEWDALDVPAYVEDDLAPRWASAHPWVEVSDFDSWQQVAAWGARLFATKPPPPSSALAAWVKSARAETPSDEDFTLRVLRFVQDQIRYVGIETGMGRRQPTDPATVFTRRYGDCKDKTVLLVAILRLAGVTATPALVSTSIGHILDQSTPTPDVFDHAIVRVVLGGQAFWVDPTASLQGGALDRYQYSPYERALTLDPSTRALDALMTDPAGDVSRAVSDHFTVHEGSDETLLDTERTYFGPVADAMRATVRQSSAEELSKFVIALYRDDFPAIHAVAPVDESDDRDRNVLHLVAHLGIPGFWRASRDGTVASVHARSLQDLVPRPPSATRSEPIAVTFPFRATHAITVDLPFELPVKPETITTKTSAFELDFASAGGGHQVRYSYDLATRGPMVTESDLGTYLERADEARAQLDRSILRYATVPDGLNWGALVAFLGCVPFILFGALKAYRFVPARLRPPWEPAILDPRLQGIRGWLLVLALGVLANPLYMLANVVRDARVTLSLAKWHALTSPGLPSYSPALAVLAIVEGLVCSWFFAYGLGLASLFFRKRRSFPHHFVLFATSVATFVVVDEVLALSLSEAASTAERGIQGMTGVIRTVAWAAVWTAYVRQSRRVASTFVR